jgi:CheY-like chemotaxis protein
MADKCQGIMKPKRPLHVLCADDNAILGEIMVCLLAREGHWVEQVEDGAKAWDRLSADIDGFDVVVTDHQMPGLTGLELVERLRGANFAGRVVVHSSGVTPEQAARYRALGAARFVPKASSADQLLRAVVA